MGEDFGVFLSLLSWFLVKLLIGQLAPWATWMGYLTLAHKTWVLGAGSHALNALKA